jgi:hypothetical protein
MKWLVRYNVKGKWLSRYEFGEWDEIMAKYVGKSARLTLCNEV